MLKPKIAVECSPADSSGQWDRADHGVLVVHIFFDLMCSQARMGAWLDLGGCGFIVFEGPDDMCFAPGSKCWCIWRPLILMVRVTECR